MTRKIIDKGKALFSSIRKRITPAFIVTLALALILWYSGKLQYTYTAEVPVSIVIEGERHRVTCVVEATGHNIVSARFFKRKTIKVRRGEVELLPVEGVSDTYSVSPASLQNLISVRNPSLKVLSVSQMPYIHLTDN